MYLVLEVPRYSTYMYLPTCTFDVVIRITCDVIFQRQHACELSLSLPSHRSRRTTSGPFLLKNRYLN
jgi:hypothetical protein